MSDKIIELQNHIINKNEIEKEEIIDLANQSLEEIIKFLDSSGYDISDPAFQLDFEVLHVLLQGTLLRQQGIEFHGIDLLDFIEHDGKNEPA